MGEPVFVSRVMGEGASAHRIVRVAQWEFRAPEGDAHRELLIADADLAPRLEMHLHNLRKLSRRYERSKDINPRIEFCPAVEETPKSHGNQGGRPARRRFYSRADALFLVTRSEAPGAIELTKEMIRVFLAAMEGLLVPAGHLPAEDAARLRRELEDVRAGGLAGVIGPVRAERDILAPLAKAAPLHPKGKRAGLRWLNNKLRNAVGHNGEKSAWRLLPAVDLADAQRALEKAADDLAALRAAAAAAQQLTFVFVLNPKPRRGN